MIQLSIIIPHFNRPAKLERLLKTIPCNEELEIIVVDDSSTKDVDEYELLKSRYTYVKFYDNDMEHKGAGGTRNVGLNKASGKWILFADSDDYFLGNMWDTVSKYFDNDEDMIYFVPYAVYEGSAMTSPRHLPFSAQVLDYCNRDGNKRREELILRKDYISPISRLYRRAFIENNNIRFEIVSIAEDMMWSALCGAAARSITASYEVFYVITDSDESLMHHMDETKAQTQRELQDRYVRFWDEHMTLEDLATYHQLGIKGKLMMRLRKAIKHKTV